MSDAPPLSSRARAWRWRVFSATWLSYFGFYFARKPFYITKAALGDALGWDAATLGLIGTAYLLAYTVGQFVAGTLGNRTGPRVLLLAGMLVSAGANAAFGLTNSEATFVALMALNGLSQATGWPGNVGTMANWFRREERGTVMGFWATNYQVGGVAANTLAAWVLGRWGFRYSFFAGSLVLLLIWGWFLLNQRNRPEDVGLEPIARDEAAPGAPVDEEAGGWSRDAWINVLLVGFFYFFVKFIRYALWSWAPYMLQKNYGLAGDEAGFTSTAFDVAGIVGVIAAGWISDRFFRGRRARVSFLFISGMAASTLALALLGPHSLLLFGVSIAFIGFFLYGPDALMTGAGAIEAGSIRQATLAAGIINGMGSAGSVLQELILGQLLDERGTVGVFVALLISAVAAASSLLLLLARNRSGRADL